MNEEIKETLTLCDVSADHGKTWTAQWLTPTDILRHRIDGYVTRPHYREKTIRFFPGNSAEPIKITLSVPYLCDPEEYIDAYLDGMLNDFLRYNSDWDFVLRHSDRTNLTLREECGAENNP